MEKNRISQAVTQDPTGLLLLGAGPALARSYGLIPALCMSGLTLFLLLCSSLLVRTFRGLIGQRQLLYGGILIIAGLVSIAQLLLQAFLPGVFELLGVYLNLSAASLLVFSVAERSRDRALSASLLESLLVGLGFTAVLLVMGAVRELLGSGSIGGISLGFFESHKIQFFAQAPGGFISLAFVAALINRLKDKVNKNSPDTADSGREAEERVK